MSKVYQNLDHLFFRKFKDLETDISFSKTY